MIFSIFVFLTLFISIGIKDRKSSLIVQSFSCIFEAIYDFLISAYTGAFLNIVNFIRSFLFFSKDRYSKKLYFFFFLFFEGVIVINCYITWQGSISLFPTIGSMIRVYCLWQENMTLVRISGLTTSIFYGTYYLYYHSFFLVFGYILLFMVSIFSIYYHDRKKILG